MKLLLYLIAEFLHMVAAALLIVILFFGGWHLWGMPAGDEVSWFVALARIFILITKTLLVILFFMMVRWSWPRFLSLIHIWRCLKRSSGLCLLSRRKCVFI